MILVATEAAPPRLRGRLALWLLEVRAGVYVGDYGPRVRDELWREVCLHIEDGSAVMVWTDRSEAGFAFDTVGVNRRVPLDRDGLPSVAFEPADPDHELDDFEAPPDPVSERIEVERAFASWRLYCLGEGERAVQLDLFGDIAGTPGFVSEGGATESDDGEAEDEPW